MEFERRYHTGELRGEFKSAPPAYEESAALKEVVASDFAERVIKPTETGQKHVIVQFYHLEEKTKKQETGYKKLLPAWTELGNIVLKAQSGKCGCP